MPVKNIIPGQRVAKDKLERARELRREMTPAEKILWDELRGNKLAPLSISLREPSADIPPFSHRMLYHFLDLQL